MLDHLEPRDWLSLMAIAVSVLALFVSIFNARISSRSLKQSGAVLSSEGLLQLESPTAAKPEGSITMEVKVYNRGRAEVDLVGVDFSLLVERLAIHVPLPEGNLRIPGFSYKTWSFDLRPLIENRLITEKHVRALVGVSLKFGNGKGVYNLAGLLGELIGSTSRRGMIYNISPELLEASIDQYEERREYNPGWDIHKEDYWGSIKLLEEGSNRDSSS